MKGEIFESVPFLNSGTKWYKWDKWYNWNKWNEWNKWYINFSGTKVEQ